MCDFNAHIAEMLQPFNRDSVPYHVAHNTSSWASVQKDWQEVDIQTEANAFIMKGCSGAMAAEGMTESEKEKWSIECKAKERENVSENAQINLNLGKMGFYLLFCSVRFDILCKLTHSQLCKCNLFIPKNVIVMNWSKVTGTLNYVHR